MQPDRSNRTIMPAKSVITLELLNSEQVNAIHEASLHILYTTGIKMPSPRVMDIFDEAGARVDREKSRVYIPPDLVEKALKNAGKKYTLCARDKNLDLRLDGTCGYLTTDGCGLQVIDLHSGLPRNSILKDLEEATIVADYLEQISFLWPLVSARDCPEHKQPLYELAALLTYSTKHVQAMTAVNAEAARGSVEMAAVVSGGKEKLKQRPLISNFQCSISPLAYDPAGLEAAMVFADAGIPTGFLTMQIACSTAPVTTAGSLAQGNAENLAGITFLQTYKPGSPTFYGSCATVMELRSGAVACGGPEDFMQQSFAAQMARHYGLPSNVGTFATGAKASNWHAGVENALSGAISVLSGADMMCGAGLLSGAAVFAFEQLILDCEIFEMIRRIAEGITINDETLALDTIAGVGPDGHFMVEEHTLKHLRGLWQPMVIERSARVGQQTMEEGGTLRQAKEKAAWILKNHRPDLLEEKMRKELADIIASFC